MVLVGAQDKAEIALYSKGHKEITGCQSPWTWVSQGCALDATLGHTSSIREEWIRLARFANCVG